jgi:hypothetical protein
MTWLVLSAGMQRSGSTWLYNALRLLLQQTLPPHATLACAWIGDAAKLSGTEDCQLLKIHDFDATLAARARFIAYSFRDPRDAMVSQHRKFGTAPSLALASHMIRQHALWSAVANHWVRYEDMLDDAAAVIAALATALGLDLDAVGVEALRAKLEQLSYESAGPRNDRYHELTLFHRGHRTTDGRPGQWREQLPAALIAAIEDRHGDWLDQQGYPRT